ncbi:glycosyltransferase [Perilla frutescens var. frutescens]|nr:glycosyltransferase [Perilla frutescens var. frutescens]
MPQYYSSSSNSSETTTTTATFINDPLKPYKHLLLSPPANFMRSLVAICLFGAFSFFYLSSFPATTWRTNGCPQCDPHAYRRLGVGLGAGVVEEEAKTNISHILFGIGGSAETWSRRRRYCELWWKPNATRGFVWLDKKPGKAAPPWPDTSPPYRVSADTARFKYTNWYGSRSAVRIARIVKESFEAGMENVRWFVMGDDDTVFFTENLVDLLSRYDHRQMYYIGGNSESVEQNVVHSYQMAYGGGGFAVSYPLAAELVRILDGCIDRYAAVYGSDLKIGGCVNEIGMDVRGSPFGLLSAHPIAPLISLHHLDYVQPIFPGTNRVDSIKRLLRAYETDPSRALQQSFCYHPTRNWSISISWGYNVLLYPFMVTAKDLSTPLQTFLTWGSWSQQPFVFNTRVMRFNPCERPIVHYLDRVNGSGSGSWSGTTTSYKRPHTERGRQCKKESYAKAYLVREFNVTADVLDPQIWKKGPRRQCCEITDGSDEVDGVVQVRIRGCNQWESVTPRYR